MKKNVLLIVQNNSFPFDKRIYKEALSLSANLYNVFVISPRSEYDKEKYSEISRIKVIRYRNHISDGSFIGFFKEFLISIIKIYFLSISLFIKQNIRIVHVANPPDFFWPLAIICKSLGIKFIFDQHDLAPELFNTKFKNKFFHKLLLVSEKLSVLFSDGIIVVNDSFKNRLITKWGINSKPIEVVYNSPEENFIPIKNTELIEKYKSKKVILYVGLMTVNDNIEIIIEAAKKIIIEHKRPEFQFILLGDGDVRRQAEMTARKYGIEKNIEFKGIVDHKTVKEFLYVADICLAPDFPNGLNEYLTLIKILEYMKSKKPFVSFDLLETRIIGDGAGLFAKDIDDFTQKIIFLNDNPEICNELGMRGEEIINKKFLWKYSERSMLNLYSKLDQKK